MHKERDVSTRIRLMLTGATFLAAGAHAYGVSSALAGATGHDLAELRAGGFLVGLLALVVGLRGLARGLAVRP